jgi:starch-binding outer membrane protein, SusD/RagB family
MIMKKNFIHIGLLLLLVLAGTSCKKWLSLEPQDGITRDKFWKTKEQVQSAVMGCYASLLGDPAGRDKPLSEYFFLWGELRGDMLAPAAGVTTDELDVMNVNTLPTNSITNWSAVYRTINYCNTVIDFAPGVLDNDKTFTQAQLNGYLAEARGLRALMYFYLVRSFRDVPLKLNSTADDDDLEQLPKTSADTVLTQIVADLQFADDNAVFNYNNTAANKGRINKYTVKAIQADVYLWMEKYNECIAACDFIINSNRFGLVAGNSGWFNTLYYNGNSNESIFEFQFDQQKLNSVHPMFTTSRSRFLANQTVIEDVYTIDFLDDTKKDIRGEFGSVRTDNVIFKYLGVTGSSSLLRAADASFAHWFVYRYADILLMKAEALNETGQGAAALDIVKIIRNRAHALDATDRNPVTNPMDPNDKNAVADFILEERAREFAFEGKRWYDVLRNAKRNKYERLNVLLNMVAKSVPASMQQSAIGKYRDPNSHYFPINFYEIQTDPHLVQNPFYR